MPSSLACQGSKKRTDTTNHENQLPPGPGRHQLIRMNDRRENEQDHKHDAYGQRKSVAVRCVNEGRLCHATGLGNHVEKSNESTLVALTPNLCFFAFILAKSETEKYCKTRQGFCQSGSRNDKAQARILRCKARELRCKARLLF